MAAVRSVAPAKLNLALAVLGRRGDGYHEIDSLAATLNLADELALSDAGRRSIAYAGESGQPVSIETDEDIVLRAWRALADRVDGIPDGGTVRVVKRIPVAAGLGGGSADAAAFLRAANALWGLGLDREALIEIGASVGSDVPACLVGGLVRMRGRGERVEALADAEGGDLRAVLFTPEIPVPEGKTAAMYRALRPPHFGAGAGIAAMPAAQDGGSNTFDQVADEVLTGLRPQRRRFAAAIARACIAEGVDPVAPLLAGAGPTLFALLPARVAEAVVAQMGGLAARTRVCGFVGRAEATRVERAVEGAAEC